jgi:hypothetical protein
MRRAAADPTPHPFGLTADLTTAGRRLWLQSGREQVLALH